MNELPWVCYSRFQAMDLMMTQLSGMGAGPIPSKRFLPCLKRSQKVLSLTPTNYLIWLRHPDRQAMSVYGLTRQNTYANSLPKEKRATALSL